LVDHVQRFLLELGSGVAFVGRQVPLEVGDQDFVLDLSAADDLLRHPYDQPTIGLLLCRGRNRIVAENALRHLKRPVGIAEWETRLAEKLPKSLAGSLPTVKEIEAELVGAAKPAAKKRGRQA